MKTDRNSVPNVAPGIGTRIDAVSKLVGTRAEAAKAALVSDDMLYRYIREDSPPSFSAMAGLAKAAGVSLDWIATGQGHMMAGSGASSVPSISRDIMADVIEVVLRELDSQGKTLSPDKMSQLMLLIHDEILESEQTATGVDRSKVIRLIKLAS